jgi:hypothetical protein
MSCMRYVRYGRLSSVSTTRPHDAGFLDLAVSRNLTKILFGANRCQFSRTSSRSPASSIAMLRASRDRASPRSAPPAVTSVLGSKADLIRSSAEHSRHRTFGSGLRRCDIRKTVGREDQIRGNCF